MISVEILVNLEDEDGITWLEHEIITSFTGEHKDEELFAILIEKQASKIFEELREKLSLYKRDTGMLSDEESDDIINSL